MKLNKDLSSNLNSDQGDILDFQKVRELWGQNHQKTEDLFSTTTQFSTGVVKAPTHMVGLNSEDLILLPYESVEAPYHKSLVGKIEPGEIGISIMHHSPIPDSNPKESIKLQCTHIQLVMGVKAGVVTINNPSKYLAGSFGDKSYPMIISKIKSNGRVPGDLWTKYEKNIRTWAVIANAFTVFPDDYNGSDPLKVRTKEQLIEFGNYLLEALCGDEGAREWLRHPNQHLYCAELAFIAMNLGLYFPISEMKIGSDLFSRVKAALAEFDFVAKTQNPVIDQIEISVAEEEFPSYSHFVGSGEIKDGFWSNLIVRPYFASDMIERYIQAVVPRNMLGEEEGSQFQKELVKKIKLPLFEMLNLPEKMRDKFESLFADLVSIIGIEYRSYEEFRDAIEPRLIEISKLASHDGKAYIPPSLYLDELTKNQIGISNGIVRWEYVGHGIHKSVIKEN